MTHLSVREWGRVPVGEDGFTRDQTNILLAAARAHRCGGSEGTAILTDHHRHLTAKQVVGVLAGSDCSLEILPKVDPERPDEDASSVRRRLITMLDVALGLDLSAGAPTELDRQGALANAASKRSARGEFRDTWADGIHSYLTYLRDRLTVARDLLTESDSVFVQIGDENVHRVRALMDEIFGDENFIAQITFRVKSPLGVSDLARTTDFICWYSKNKEHMKFRQAKNPKLLDEHSEFNQAIDDGGVQVSRSEALDRGINEDLFFTAQNLASSGYTPSCTYSYEIHGKLYPSPKGKSWKTNLLGMDRLRMADRLQPLKTSLRWRYFFGDAASEVITDVWTDTFAAPDKAYVVQTSESVIQRCILMTTDPGDLVLDPTCGSGTTAYVAEQWGRRWITIDTSRVALALARARIMGARYPWYLLADSREGQVKEGEITRTPPRDTAPKDGRQGRIRQGFVYKRVPHITLKSIANNAEIDTIWEDYQTRLEPLRDALNAALGTQWQEWEIPRVLTEEQAALPSRLREGSGVGASLNPAADPGPPLTPPASGKGMASELHAEWWAQRIARQKEIDASIAAKADTE